MKYCTICKIEKEYDCFHKKSTSKDGYRSQCKECRKIEYSLIPDKTIIPDYDNKICITCNLEKSVDYFQKRKDTKDGYRGDCKDCRSIYLKEYKKNNKEKIKVHSKTYVDNNQEKIKEYNKKRPKKYNYRPYDEKRKLYKKENKEKINLSNNNYRNNRRKIDLTYKLYENMRKMITRSIKSKKFHKNSNTKTILGCDADYFRNYLESKFESWMTWDNYGKYNGEFNYGWDIDHIIPLSSTSSIEELNLLNNHTNLQPLCSKVNRDIKKDKMCFIHILS